MTSHDTTTVSNESPTSPADGLTVVMPAYNEGAWVRRAIVALRRSAEAAGWSHVTFVVVDDGSTDVESVRVLDELGASPDVRLLRQSNAGRFVARANGIAEVRTPYVLLLDARVEVDVAALSRIRHGIRDEGLDVWNFDVSPGSKSLGALFWTGITKVWWPDYFRRPRRVSFGAADFGRFPKGTTAFFAPVALLREAMAEFHSHFDDLALASDDTRLLLGIAERTPITLSPEVACRHHLKAGWRAWCRQGYYRGTTFVDGYLGDRDQAPVAMAAVVAALLVGGVVTLRTPWLAAAGVVVGSATTAALARRSGATARESGSVGILTLPFGAIFGAGVVRGLRMVSSRRG
jgi:glycosyltransferase involved in cell wall biosynthesis